MQAAISRQWAVKESDVSIGRVVSQGGFGEVLEGTWLGHTKVAVKRLLAKPGRDIMIDFEREVSNWHSLRHPNVLPFFGACVEATLPFMISPFMENGNVLDFLSALEDGPTNDVRMGLVYDIAKGMQYLHSKKVIHSDLKALNVLVNNDGAAMVTDFGFVRIRSRTRSSLSKNVQLPGTMQWMPPERHQDGTCDERGDVYAFAMTCVEIWTLDVPFGGIPDSPYLYQRIITENFRPDLNKIPDMPQEIKQLLRACWEKDPTKRPSFAEIAERLKTLAPAPSRAGAIARAAEEPQALSQRAETLPPPYQTVIPPESVTVVPTPRSPPPATDLAEARRLYRRALQEIPEEYPARRWRAAEPFLQQACALGSPDAKALLAYGCFQEHGSLGYHSEPFRTEDVWNKYVIGLIRKLDNIDDMCPAELIMAGLGCHMFQGIFNDEAKGRKLHGSCMAHAFDKLDRSCDTLEGQLSASYLGEFVWKPFEERMKDRDATVLDDDQFKLGAQLLNKAGDKGHGRANQALAMMCVRFMVFDTALEFMNKAARVEYPGAGELAAKIRENVTSTSSEAPTGRSAETKAKVPKRPADSDDGLKNNSSVEEQDHTLVVDSGAGSLGRVTQSPETGTAEWEIGEYDVALEQKLAQGGYGEVFIGSWQSVPVAVKKLLSHALTADLKKDFMDEVSIWHKLRHPNVILLLGACVESSSPFMVSQFMENGDVTKYLQLNANMGPVRKVELMGDIAKGMSYLHSKNIIHSDLKGLNVLVDSMGHGLITDFGFARVRSASPLIDLPGTAIYMPPERFIYGVSDKAGDIYAFGITCYQIWTNSKPFAGGPQGDELYRKIAYEGYRPDRLKPMLDAPPELIKIVRECWDEDPQKRPPFSGLIVKLSDL
ncbi:hypothetical protein HDU93_007659 [Gonapodya sp. JEL0774]|nr:hypothetical protein HDU93_007659 [Gonapodya sp. JEL0774]